MGKSAAKEGDKITGTDTHIVNLILPPAIPMPGHRFDGTLDGNLSDDVKIMGKKAAVVGSTATNTPHVANGVSFAVPPKDEGEVTAGSGSVKINGKKAARDGDTATTCNDPPIPDAGKVEVPGRCTVKIGD